MCKRSDTWYHYVVVRNKTVTSGGRENNVTPAPGTSRVSKLRRVTHANVTSNVRVSSETLLHLPHSNIINTEETIPPDPSYVEEK